MESQTATTTSSGGMEFMIIFNIFIAIYMLFYAFKGTGKIYENEYPQEMQEEYVKLLRMFCWFTGIGLLILSILEYIYGFYSVFGVVSIVFVLGAIAVYFVLFRVRFKSYVEQSRAARKKKREDKKKK